jgi:hypothetical protein
VDRRTFASAALLTAAAPLLASATPAFANNAPAQGRDGKLARTMLDALARELDDAETAALVEPVIEGIGFDWHPPTAAVDGFDFIVAYGFGNRPPEGGGDPTRVLYEPGPVNEQLADTVALLRQKRNVPVYAQWEIARFLDSKYGMADVTSIEPVIAGDGTITYLSTDGVAAQVAALRNGRPGSAAGVVGFRDHIKRCVQTTRDRGMQAYAPEGVDMPGTYDLQSGQAWTRRRDLYLVHDMFAQLGVVRGKLIAGAYPNG